VEGGHKDHENRISDLERTRLQSGGSSKSLKIIKTKTAPSNDDKLKELEAECNAVADRIQGIESETHKFLAVDYEDIKDVKREIDDLLRNISALKSRTSSLEDRAKIIIINNTGEEKKEQERGNILTEEIETLKSKLKKLEDDLRALKKKMFSKKPAPVTNEDGEIDYMALINEMKDQMERDVHDLNDRLNGIVDNEERLKQIEGNVSNLQDSQEEQDRLLEKLSSDTDKLKEDSDKLKD
jgi:chromosome segregation ATPase